MEENQIKQIYSIIAGAFQVQLKQLDSGMYYSTLCLFLKDKDYMLVANNLKKHVDSSPYLPTIADLVKEDTNYSTVPGVEETRLMIEERERERENHVPSDPEYVKKLIAETRLKLKEVRLNELEREHKRLSES